MVALMRRIATAEGASISDDALALITRAAEGSARDATSLLDQAISHGAGETTAEEVRAMLGLADRGRVLDLLDAILRGDAAAALAELAAQYSEGADPMAVLRDLAEITHWISVVKITPDAAEDPTIAPEERSRGKALAEALPIRVPSRLWQMLLKAIEETASAPNAMMAAEMAIIRMTHVADLPSPEELVRKLSGSTPPPPPGPGGGNTAQTASDAPGPASTLVSKPTNGGGTHSRLATAPVAEAEAALSRFPTFEHVVELIRANRDVRLLVEVETCLRLAAYRPGRIEFTPTPDAPADLAQRLGARLHLWTGNRWAVTLVNGCEVETIAEVRDAKENALKRDALEHPMMQAVLAQFPAARIVAIRTPQDIAADAGAEALPEVEDEWDPFEDG